MGDLALRPFVPNGSPSLSPTPFLQESAPSGSQLLYSTFLGSDNQDYGRGLAIDETGNAYVTGNAGSSTFPTTPGAFDTTFDGTGDARRFRYHS